jgi:hypothetical protein
VPNWALLIACSYTEGKSAFAILLLIGQDLAIPLDVEFQRPGEGEVPAVNRLLQRVFGNCSRHFDAPGARFQARTDGDRQFRA